MISYVRISWQTRFKQMIKMNSLEIELCVCFTKTLIRPHNLKQTVWVKKAPARQTDCIERQEQYSFERWQCTIVNAIAYCWLGLARNRNGMCIQHEDYIVIRCHLECLCQGILRASLEHLARQLMCLFCCSDNMHRLEICVSSFIYYDSFHHLWCSLSICLINFCSKTLDTPDILVSEMAKSLAPINWKSFSNRLRATKADIHPNCTGWDEKRQRTQWVSFKEM